MLQLIEDGISSAGRYFKDLAELLDMCSLGHNYCSSCQRTRECQRIWLDVIKKTLTSELGLNDFIEFSARFRMLANDSKSSSQ